MKKYILSTLFLVLTTSFCYSQVKVSVQGGAGFSGITKEKQYKANLGYRFGVGVEFPLTHALSLQTGVQFLNRKSTIDKDALETRQHEGTDFILYKVMTAKMNAMYLQLPIKIATYVPLNTNCGLQISVGPYLAYGIGGNHYGEMIQHAYWTDNNSFVPEEVSVLSIHQGFRLKTFDKNIGLKRMDIGLSAGVDFKYKSFFIGTGVEYGLLPISKEFKKDAFNYTFGEDKTTTSPHNFGVEFHVGYNFSLGK